MLRVRVDEDSEDGYIVTTVGLMVISKRVDGY